MDAVPAATDPIEQHFPVETCIEKPSACSSNSLTFPQNGHSLKQRAVSPKSQTFGEGVDHKKRQGRGLNIMLLVHKDNIGIVTRVLNGGNSVQLLPYLREVDEPLQKFEDKVLDMSNDIWILVGDEFSRDTAWVNCTNELIRRRKGKISMLKLPPKSLDVKLLLESPKAASQRSQGMKDLYFVSLDTVDSSEFFVRHYGNRLTRIRAALVCDEPLLTAEITLISNVEDDGSYVERMNDILLETLQDPATTIRQELQQLYQIASVNVYTREAENDGSVEKVIVELRPSDPLAFMSFVDACRNRVFQGVLQENVRLFDQPFIGIAEINFKDDDVTKVVRLLESERTLREPFNGLNSTHVILSEPVALKSLLLTAEYVEFLTDPTLSPYEFVVKIEALGCNNVLRDVKDDFGRNALHLAVLHQRIDFLWFIYYSNYWGELRNGMITKQDPERMKKSLPSRKNFTGYRLAETLSFKAKGYDVLCAYHLIDRMWVTMPDISHACRLGRLDLVKIMIESDATLIKERDIGNNSCLHYACASGNVELVSYLLGRIRDVDDINANSSNVKQETCAHIAAMLGHTGVLRVLSEKVLNLHGPRNVHRFNALDYCIRNDDMPSVELFKETCPKLDPRCLNTAIQHRKTNIVQFLVRQCDVDVNAGQDHEKRLPVHHAVIMNDLESLNLLLENGADVAATDTFKKTTFHLAAENGCSVQLVDRLVQKAKADNTLGRLINAQEFWSSRSQNYLVRGKDRGRRAWHWIELKALSHYAFQKDLTSGQIDVATHGRILFSGYGQSPGPAENNRIQETQQENLNKKLPNETALHMAADKGHDENVAKLLVNGADVNIQTFSKIAAVHLAAMRGHLKVMQLLEEAGADMEVSTDGGDTPLSIAQNNGHVEVVNFIQGIVDMAMAKRFLEGHLHDKERKLDGKFLDSQRTMGEDLRRHVISALRDLTIDIHEVLRDLGSGPIAQQSRDSST